MDQFGVDASRVYWTATGAIWNQAGFYEGTVMSMPIGGGPAASLARQQDLAGPFAVAENSLYWAVNGVPNVRPAVVRLKGDACRAGVCN